MSIVICEDCDAYIDSDWDGECFVEVGNMKRQHQTKVMCEPCRDKYFEKLEDDSNHGPQEAAHG